MFLQLVAVAAREKARAQTFAEKFKFRKAYASYDDLEKDPNIGKLNRAQVVWLHHHVCFSIFFKGEQL